MQSTATFLLFRRKVEDFGGERSLADQLRNYRNKYQAVDNYYCWSFVNWWIVGFIQLKGFSSWHLPKLYELEVP